MRSIILQGFRPNLDEESAGRSTKYVPIIEQVLPGTKIVSFGPDRSSSKQPERPRTGIPNSLGRTAALAAHSGQAMRFAHPEIHCTVLGLLRHGIVQYSLAITRPVSPAGLAEHREHSSMSLRSRVPFALSFWFSVLVHCDFVPCKGQPP